MTSGEISQLVSILNNKGQTLRPHQIEGLQFLIKCFDEKHGCILADEMGLGKTCQTAILFELLGSIRNVNVTHLIICPLSVLDHWKVEINRFAPSIKLRVFKGSKEEREPLKTELEMSQKSWSCLLTTYELFSKDVQWFQSFSWGTLTIDEGHRLKNHKSLINTNVRETTAGWVLLLTGTPIQNNLDELFSLLNVADSNQFSQNNRDQFIEKFSSGKNIPELKSLLSKYMLRRTKDGVCSDIPEKGEVVMYHTITQLQKRLYKAILQRNHDAFGRSDNEVGKQSLMNTLIQLRKCIDHPYLFDGIEPEPFEEGEHLIESSGKLIVLNALLCHAKVEGHRVLLFSQMTRMLDILQDYLAFRGFSYERLDGSVRGEERYAAVDRFNKLDSDTFCFLLSTKAGGVGLNLTSADTVIFVDSDFNPQNDIQAAARAHRIGQNKPVKIIRLIGKHTVEEVIMARASRKLALTRSIIEEGNVEEKLTAAELTDMLTYGLQKLTTQDDEKQFTDFDFASLIGGSKNGEWLPLKSDINDADSTNLTSNGTCDSVTVPNNATESIYMFEGHDYKEDQILADKKALNEIIWTGKKEETGRKGREALVSPLTFNPRPAKILNPEELEERKRKRQLTVEKRKLKLQEERQLQAQKALQRKLDNWKVKGYVSSNLTEPSEDVEVDEDEAVADTLQPIFVVGNVAQPQLSKDHENLDALVVHIVDDSGSWGSGGVFTALTNRSPQPKNSYKLAARMEDLALGDAHKIPIDDVSSRDGGSDYAVLLVAMSKRNRACIDMEALSLGLQRISNLSNATNKKFSVHLPRIGYGMPKVKWYGIERTIRKELCSKGIPTYIYYFKRKTAEKRKNSGDGEDVPAKRRDSSEIPSTSHGDSTMTPQLLDSLFEEYTMYLGAMDETTRNKLTRLIIAFDGQVTVNINDPQLTHVIVGSQNVNSQLSKDLSNVSDDIHIVTQAWLDSCIQDKRIVPTDMFAFTEEDPS